MLNNIVMAPANTGSDNKVGISSLGPHKKGNLCIVIPDPCMSKIVIKLTESKIDEIPDR